MNQRKHVQSSYAAPAASSTPISTRVSTNVRVGYLNTVTEATIDPSGKTTVSVSVSLTDRVDMGKGMMLRTTIYRTVLPDGCPCGGVKGIGSGKTEEGKGTVALALRVGSEEVKGGVMERIGWWTFE